MQIKFFQAECGDAAMISFTGTDQKQHHVLMDTGYERTFSHVLEKAIEHIAQQNESIDLCVVSHIHDDHIGGIIKFIEAIQDKRVNDIVQSWHYNSPRKKSSGNSATNPVSRVASISQGDDLLHYLVKNNKMPKHDITNSLPSFDLYGLSITILSPDDKALGKLRAKYANGQVLERNELDDTSFAVAVATLDYNIALDTFDLSRWNEDNSPENASSIAMLTEFKSRRVLWLADAIPGVVVKKLKALGYSKSNPLKCEWVKVTHHGSKGNNNNELYEMISCENYLVSADGINRHCLPTKECLARILRASNRPAGSHYKFYFTYDNDLIRSMFQSDGKDVFKKYNFSVYYPNSGERYIQVQLT